jgi:hypothetical protein
MAKKTTLPEWDRLVAPILQRITASALICRDRARSITLEVAILQSRPDWLTRAQDTMKDARKELQEALARIESAEAAYKAIEVERDDD